MSITQFTMEEVRCFGERQTLEIRPLTILVGENSTGKTTALACFHILASYLQNGVLDFNVDPYSLGTFLDIVRKSRKKDKIFKIGFSYKHGNKVDEWLVEFAAKKGGVEPSTSSVKLKFNDGSIHLNISEKHAKTPHLVDYNEKLNKYEIECGDDVIGRMSTVGITLDFLDGKSRGKDALTGYIYEHEESVSTKFGPWDVWQSVSVFSTSPIRSQPKRTYDPIREFFDPEGSDIPMLLMQIEATKKNEWEILKQQLIEFGRNSGLFQDIKIENFGRTLGGPFQLQFKVRGPTSNIMDVGYGVSQILPIIVPMLIHGINKQTKPAYKNIPYFLLQQPEVHLHPKAQAELSSLLTKLASQGDQTFIVETHSDYIIDRARIEIRRGNIKPEDVSLIYFEPIKNVVKVHNISFDKMANMEGVPPHYEKFFLNETNRLMGFED